MTQTNHELESVSSRGQVLIVLTWCLNELQRKLKTGRLKNIPLEKARNEKIRLLVYTCQVMAGVIKDQDIDEIKRRIDVLENR